jgi:hypothetical protein
VSALHLVAAALIAAIVLLQAADVVTTAKALHAGAVELNPLARRLFGALGVLPAAIALKLLGTAPIVALALLYPRLWPVPLAYAATLVWVVRHNLRELALQRRDGS